MVSGVASPPIVITPTVVDGGNLYAANTTARDALFVSGLIARQEIFVRDNGGGNPARILMLQDYAGPFATAIESVDYEVQDFGATPSVAPVRITKNGHGLTLGQAVAYQRDLSDVVATHSGEDKFNGVVCAVIDANTVDVCAPYQGPFTWPAHGFLDAYLHLGTQAQGGAWQSGIVGDFPIAGLLVIDANTVYPVAIPRIGVGVPIVVTTTAEMDTNERFYRLSQNDPPFNAGLYYRTGNVNTFLHGV